MDPFFSVGAAQISPQSTQLTQTRFLPVETGQWIAEEIARQHRDLRILRMARLLVAGLVEEHSDPMLSALSEMHAINNFVKTHVRYTRDPRYIELVFGPPSILEHIAVSSLRTFAEDCDGFAVFSGALALALGYPVSVVLLGYPGLSGYQHVLIRVMLPGGTWVYLDPALKSKARSSLDNAPRQLLIPVQEV